MAHIEPINNFETNGRRGPGSGRRRLEAPVGRYDGRQAATPASGLARTPTNGTAIARLNEQLARATRAAEVRRQNRRPDEEVGAWLGDCLRLENNAEQLRRRRDVLMRADSTIGAVSDPWGQGDQRLYASIDRRVDILEMERSHGRITEAAYQTGRQVQAVLERIGKVRSASLGDGGRGDPSEARVSQMAHNICNAKEVLSLSARIQGRIGVYDMRLLRRVIGERIGFADCAALEGKGGERGTKYVAQRFRDALEDLADVFAGKGAGQKVPDDPYKAAAVDLAPRQAAAIAGGATLRRVRDELADLRSEAAATSSFRNRARLTAAADALERRLALMDPAPCGAETQKNPAPL